MSIRIGIDTYGVKIKTDLGLRHSMGTGKSLSETPSWENPSLEEWPCM